MKTPGQREAARVANKLRRARWRFLGLCIRCGNVPNAGTLCPYHTQKNRSSSRECQARKRSA